MYLKKKKIKYVAADYKMPEIRLSQLTKIVTRGTIICAIFKGCITTSVCTEKSY